MHESQHGQRQRPAPDRFEPEYWERAGSGPAKRQRTDSAGNAEQMGEGSPEETWKKQQSLEEIMSTQHSELAQLRAFKKAALELMGKHGLTLDEQPILDQCTVNAQPEGGGGSGAVGDQQRCAVPVEELSVKELKAELNERCVSADALRFCLEKSDFQKLLVEAREQAEASDDGFISAKPYVPRVKHEEAVPLPSSGLWGVSGRRAQEAERAQLAQRLQAAEGTQAQRLQAAQEAERAKLEREASARRIKQEMQQASEEAERARLAERRRLDAEEEERRRLEADARSSFVAQNTSGVEDVYNDVD